ncbi:hypothetical protein [Actinomycetospora sp.]|uniref:hypothetical protein n=1 Tax=Actinomycetospora sp. TaxID=1872135 RepID=UPI002F3E7A32
MAVNATVRITDPAELPRAAAALGRHAQELDAARRGVESAGARIDAEVRAAVDGLRRGVEHARRQLASVDPRDQARFQRAQAELAGAVDDLEDGKRIQREVAAVLVDLRRETSARVDAGRSLAQRGAAQLRTFWERLGRASAAFSSAVARHHAPRDVADPRRILTRSGAPPSPRAVTPGTEGPLDRMLDDVVDHIVDEAREKVVDTLRDEVAGQVRDAVRGAHCPRIGSTDRVLVPLDRLVDLDPISGPADFVKITPQEMMDGLRLLEDDLLPLLEPGTGRDDLRALDERAGLVGTARSLLAIYDVFFGGAEHAVVAVRRPDGRFEIQAGRHRLWVARRLHLNGLPVLVREVP